MRWGATPLLARYACTAAARACDSRVLVAADPVLSVCPEISILMSGFATSEAATISRRSEEHTSELQSQSNLVCRLLLEKKKKNKVRRIRSEIQEFVLKILFTDELAMRTNLIILI